MLTSNGKLAFSGMASVTVIKTSESLNAQEKFSAATSSIFRSHSSEILNA